MQCLTTWVSLESLSNTSFFLYATLLQAWPGRNWQKNQVNAKQYAEAELFLFENYLHGSSSVSSKNNRIYSKK